MDTQKRKLTALALCGLAFAACSTASPKRENPRPATLGSEFSSVRASEDEIGETRTAVGGETRPASEGVIVLRDALSLALERNPRLAVFSWEIRAREAAALQAGAFPNPVVTLEVENFGGSGVARDFDASESTLWLSQLIELGGKRTKRRSLAESEQAAAGWEYEAARIDTFTQVVLAFVEVLAAQERRAIAEEFVAVGQEALRVVGEQVKAGAVSAVEKSRAEVVLATSRVELTRRVRSLDAAKRVLAATWGDTSVTFSAVAGDLRADVEPPPSEASLLGQVEENPDLARWTAELAIDRARLAFEESKRIPDVTLSGGPRWLEETNDNALVFELNVPIPLFDRNEGATREARHRLAQAGEERRAAEVGVKTELGTAYQTLAATHDAAVALGEDVLPKAETALHGAMSAYRQGVFRYLDVLDAQRTLFALRGDYLESLAAYHAAVARVERLVGRPLGEIRRGDERS